MPEDALNERARAIALVDAALEILMMGVWICFQLVGGGWSCQLLIARSALADENSTIPRNELQALCSGSNLAWTVEKALEDWVVEKIVCSDSTIALSWTMSETKPLAMFHKNRVVQIRRGTELDQLYHVRTEVNSADVGTRPDKLKIQDVGPGSVWQEGYPWMRMDVEEAIEGGYIKPASSLRMTPEEENDFDKGMVYDKVPEILTRGHQVSQKRVSKIEERAAQAEYLILPTAYTFPKLVRIHSMVFSFVSKCRRGRKILSRLLAEGRLVFRMFTVQLEVEEMDETPHDDEEPVCGFSAMAMRLDLVCNEVSGVSLASVFNKDTFHNQEVRLMF